MLRGPGPRDGRPLTILLVEDNLDHVVITRQAVTSILPCEVEVVADGGKAVERLAESPQVRPRPDLILLDLHLPVMNGIDVLRWIRGDPTFHGTPVIVLTAAGEDEALILDCYASGANSFLPKPATDKRFAEALRVLAGTPRPNVEAPGAT
ncbi:MAG: response regulator [Deltaproteobacteria bacterium]|nr:response regulator [Deltaproteobacteria bacterium]